MHMALADSDFVSAISTDYDPCLFCAFDNNAVKACTDQGGGY